MIGAEKRLTACRHGIHPGPFASSLVHLPAHMVMRVGALARMLAPGMTVANARDAGVNQHAGGGAILQRHLSAGLIYDSALGRLHVPKTRPKIRTMNLSDRRSLEVALAVARALDGDPDRVLAKGLQNIARWQRSAGRRPHLQAWEAIIRQGSEAVRASLTGLDNRSRQLRSSSPFAGILSEDVRLHALEQASQNTDRTF